MFGNLGYISLSTNGAYCVCMRTSEKYGVSCEHRCDTSVGNKCELLDGNCTYGCIEGLKGVRFNLSGMLILAPGI